MRKYRTHFFPPPPINFVYSILACVPARYEARAWQMLPLKGKEKNIKVKKRKTICYFHPIFIFKTVKIIDD